ncbi:MAG: hypothetical protein ABIO65_08475, partial [Nitrospiria bacterium]
MPSDTPWVTGFLSSIIIDYLEERHPNAARALPYADVFTGSDLADRALHARELLTDPNQWLPQNALSRLIRLAEDATGETDTVYLATRAHFERPHRRGPSIFEIIATLLDDVRGVVRASGRWATAFSTYTALQTIEHAGRTEATILSRIDPRARPTRIPGLFLRGQFEGFPALFGGGTRA